MFKRFLGIAICGCFMGIAANQSMADDTFQIVIRMSKELPLNIILVSQKPEIPVVLESQIAFTLQTNSPISSAEREVLHDGLEYG